jgi:hypothetical protein
MTKEQPDFTEEGLPGPEDIGDEEERLEGGPHKKKKKEAISRELDPLEKLIKSSEESDEEDIHDEKEELGAPPEAEVKNSSEERQEKAEENLRQKVYEGYGEVVIDGKKRIAYGGEKDIYEPPVKGIRGAVKPEKVDPLENLPKQGKISDTFAETGGDWLSRKNKMPDTKHGGRQIREGKLEKRRASKLIKKDKAA